MESNKRSSLVYRKNSKKPNFKTHQINSTVGPLAYKAIMDNSVNVTVTARCEVYKILVASGLLNQEQMDQEIDSRGFFKY